MRKFVLAMMALPLTATIANAAVTDLNVEKDLSSNLIEISGKALPNESVSFQVLPEGISLRDFAQSNSKNDIITFVYECKADANGMFEVKAMLDNSGKYNVNVASADTGKEAVIENVDFYTSDVYTTKIRLVNEAKAQMGESGFINSAKASENIAVLGFNEDINNTVSIDEILKLMYKELGNKNLDADQYVKNIYLYRNCYTVIALNKGVLTELDEYVKNIIDEDSKLNKYWKKYVVSDDIEKYLIGKISRKNISNINMLKSELTAGLILAATKYPNGYMSLKELYTDYKDVIGLSRISLVNDPYKAVGGNDYSGLAYLKAAYEKAMLPVGGNSNVTGGGGGGGGGGGSSSGGKPVIQNSTVSSVVSDTNNNNNSSTQAIDIKFLDLSTYEWAYPSISVLFEKGIINGVSENQFAPSRQVKREEFVKMIVCALDLEHNTGDKFSDVDGSAWYAPYVYAAYNSGIISGVSESEFGIAKNITRQDMAVIIYNALKSKGYNGKSNPISFGDKDEIASYATEAVGELVSLGIINGVGDNTFAPRNDATRAEAAVIIARALEYLK